MNPQFSLKIDGLCCGYGGADVLHDVRLAVKPGDFFCIAGPNGCGKSTLLKAAARLIPFRGSIAVRGRETASFSRKALAAEIALLSQASSLYFPYTVADTVAMGTYARSESFFGGSRRSSRRTPGIRKTQGRQSQPEAGLPLKTDLDRVLAALELDDLRDRFISEISGGQLQRVFLARTLVQDPAVILLDEPTNHLDLKHQTALLEYLTAWTAEPGKNRAVVAVLHDLNLALRYGKNAALMQEGRIAACGPAEEVFSRGVLNGVYGMDVAGFMQESLARWK